MARRVRRAPRRSSRSNGRQGLWFRYGAFSPSSVANSSDDGQIYQNSFVDPTMWKRDDEHDNITQAKRGPGGPLLTSLFGNFSFVGQYDPGSNVPIPQMELLVWEEAEGMPPIDSFADFYTKMDNEHVLHYSLTTGRDSIVRSDVATALVRSTISKSFNIKTKVRLSGRIVMFAVRVRRWTAEYNGSDMRGSGSGYITTP